jgi:gliding motility-associated-like protein
MAVPANDVWYYFTASGFQCVININSTFQNPNVAFYSGNCNNLGGGIGGCSVGSGGSVSLTVEQMVPGTVYYIQVSGNTDQSGTFNMNIRNNKDCADCLIGSNLVVNPPPTNGAYQPGQVVNFCYTVNDWSEINTNWFHGVQITYGSGWSGLSNPVPAATVQNGGSWVWYPNGVVSTATGNNLGTGFYFNTGTGNAGNNFGDNCGPLVANVPCPGPVSWTFCWNMTVSAACNPGSNLSVTINTSGDGESGSWANIGCVDDPPTIFNAVGACCPPVMTNTNVTCYNGNNGSATATPVAGSQGPFTYSWTGPNNYTSTQANLSGASTISNLVAGTYTVNITDATNCLQTATVTVSQPAQLTLSINSQTICSGLNATLIAVPSATGGTFLWSNNSNSASISVSPSVSTSYTCNYTLNGCSVSANGTVSILALPTVNAGNNLVVCQGVNVTLAATGADSYTWSGGVAQGIPFTPPPGITTTYTVTGVNTTTGCSNTDEVNVTVNPLPQVSAGQNVAICIGSQVDLTASGAENYTWNPGGQNSQTITVSPTLNTTYTVTGTALGCTASSSVVVTVNSNAPINAGPDVAICAGQSTTLTATGGVTYNWTGLGANPVQTVTPATTTTYTVNGTDANGCLGSDQVVVTVNPNPSPVITGASTYCIGNPPTLSTTQSFTAYAWSTGSNSATTTATLANNPITVVVTNANGCQGTSPAFTVTENAVITYNETKIICQGESTLIHGNLESVAGLYSQTFTLPTGCDSIANITLVVNPLPSVNAGVDQSVCFGTNVTLTATGASTYQWTGGVVNGTPFSPVAGTITYTVTGTDANGCINSDQVSVTVNPLPNINAGANQSVCEGTQVTLTATGAVNYSWTGGVTNGLAFTPPVGINTYTVTGTDGNGCINTDQVNVTVNPLPDVFAGNDVTICDGETVTLTGSGASSYNWDNSVNNGVAFVPSLGTLTYTVTGTTLAGCTGTDQVNVTVNPNPVVSFLPDNTIGCTPLTVNFTNNTTDVSNCIWTFSNGTVINGCGSVPVTFEQGGCYDATLMTTSTNGCTSTLTATNIVCAEEPPVASFVPSSNQVSTLDTEVNFENTTIGGETYSWDFGDGSAFSNEESPAHIYPSEEQGLYPVTLIAYSPLGCPDTAITTIQVYEELIFYVPNTFTPDADDYNPTFKPVFTSGFDPQDYVLYIFNRWGEIIFESRNPEIGWDGSYGTWDQSPKQIELVQDGTYTWKIEFKVSRWDERRVAVGHVNLIR